MSQLTNITYSIEKLHHYNCSTCRGWWSAGDKNPEEMRFCPYCGLPVDKRQDISKTGRIDYTVFKKSKLNCLLRDSENRQWVPRKLKGLKWCGNTFVGFIGDDDHTYQRCKPHFYPYTYCWEGGKPPVPKGFELRLFLRGGATVEISSDDRSLNWKHVNGEKDIVTFQVLGLSKGYYW